MDNLLTLNRNISMARRKKILHAK